ncbi:MAG TPA: MlaD family protein [Planctomycetota bacterium]|nr:MlaD family protein [Planctomycetota bacterium]
MDQRKQFALGTFFIVVLALLSYATLFLTDFRWFRDSHPMVVHFREANGLRPGDSVLVAGIRQGRVTELAYDPTAVLERRVTATMLLDEEVRLRQGFVIRIEDATLLGGRQITIDPGPPEGSELAPETTLFGMVAGNPLADLGALIDENREAFRTILDNVTGFTDDLRQGRGTLGRLVSDEGLADQVTSAVGRFEAFSDNAAALTGDLREGKGAIGRLFADEELGQQLEDIAARLATITADVAEFTKDLPEGKGLLPRMINDEALADDVREVVADVRAALDKVTSGEGNLGKLIYDGEAMDHITSIFAKVDSGEGDLGALIHRTEVYDRLAGIADDLSEVSAGLRSGRGTVGKLLVDDQLYVDLQRAVELVIRSLEEYREAAPVTTFTSVLFGAF